MNQLLAALGGGGGMPGMGLSRPTGPKPDTAETIHISSLALLKMLAHGRLGVPLEVMGIMLGDVIDDYTIRVADVFAIPAIATGQFVETVDEEFQANMITMLEQVSRSEKLVGWYHSHPGMGCFLSDMDVKTAKDYEQQLPRSVSVVLDPVQSAPGKVIIDAYRTLSEPALMSTAEPRQTTSNISFLNAPLLSAVAHGLDRSYYNMPVTYRKNASEVHMLMNVHKKTWRDGLAIDNVSQHEAERNDIMLQIKALIAQSERFITQGKDEDELGGIGKVNPLTHLLQESESLMSANTDHAIGLSINSIVF